LHSHQSKGKPNTGRAKPVPRLILSSAHTQTFPDYSFLPPQLLLCQRFLALLFPLISSVQTTVIHKSEYYLRSHIPQSVGAVLLTSNLQNVGHNLPRHMKDNKYMARCFC